MYHPIKIAPSLLSANFAELGLELHRLQKAGADWIHIDIMDGHFVPNMTIGPMVVKHLRTHSPLPFDVHLMIEPVDPFLAAFAEAGADHITIHPSTTNHCHRALQMIRNLGKKAGVALNPTTSPDILDYILDDIDLILVMTVNPGFGGQRFITSQLSKIQHIRAKITHRPIEIVVDGGINRETAPQVIAAGAHVLVAGTAIFTKGDYKTHMNDLRGSHDN